MTGSNGGRPRLVVVSKVFPFPGHAGQQQRVHYKLKAFRERFHTSFLGIDDMSGTALPRLRETCDEACLLPPRYGPGLINKLRHRLAGALYTAATGLRLSNYVAGRVELTRRRVARFLETRRFDVAVYEYWHAVASVDAFHAAGTPAVLDMHDILWRSYDRRLRSRPIPGALRRLRVRQYRRREQDAWGRFDALIAINAAEERHVREILPRSVVFYAPMGTDLDLWPHCWEPAEPARLVYYGGLGNPQRQADALRCLHHVMPAVWREFPSAELWLVGSNPPDSLRALATDRRIHVTGYIEQVQEVLKTALALVCPWTGTFGFRSRLVEAMALGVPVVASADAAFGMGFESGRGILLRDSDEELAAACLDLLRDRQLACEQSRLARREIEARFSYQATYGRLSEELLGFVEQRREARGR